MCEAAKLQCICHTDHTYKETFSALTPNKMMQSGQQSEVCAYRDCINQQQD